MSATQPTIPEIAEAVATALSTNIDGLRTEAYLPDIIAPPTALVSLQQVEKQATYADGIINFHFNILIIVSRVSDRTGWETVELYASQMSDDNPQSIHGALYQDRTLGGVVSDVTYLGSSAPHAIQIQGDEAVYLALECSIIVYA